MKDEIKEILDKMIKTKQSNGVFLTAETRDKLIDYTTNLQEENEHLQKQNKGLNNLIIQHIDEEDNLIDYKSRNEKANWWLKEMLKQAKSDETKAIINGTLELLLNGGDEVDKNDN